MFSIYPILWKSIQQLLRHFYLKTTSLNPREKSGDHRSRVNESSGDNESLDKIWSIHQLLRHFTPNDQFRPRGGVTLRSHQTQSEFAQFWLRDHLYLLVRVMWVNAKYPPVQLERVKRIYLASWRCIIRTLPEFPVYSWPLYVVSSRGCVFCCERTIRGKIRGPPKSLEFISWWDTTMQVFQSGP